MSANSAVLEKLIRVAVVCSFSGKQRVLIERMENFLENTFSFVPFEEEYKALAWEEIYSIIYNGESETWFESDESDDCLELVVEIPQFVIPSSSFKHEVDWLSRTSTLQLIATFNATGKKSARKIIPVLNKMIEDNKHPPFPNISVINQTMKMIELFPKTIQEKINKLCGNNWDTSIGKIAMDLGRPYEIHMINQGKPLIDASMVVNQDDLNSIYKKVTITNDRGGVEGTLHRCSFIRNNQSQIIGLTVRIGRAIVGKSKVFSDIIEKGKKILILGKPQSGKTTLLRDIARQYAETKSTLIVDTWCEIGGFSNHPHMSIGKARRIQVKDFSQQHELILQAIHDHSPDVFVMDEILTQQDVSSVKAISHRDDSTILCMSISGNMKLQSLQNNPLLCQVLGIDPTNMKFNSNPLFDVVVQIEETERPCYEWKIFTNLKEIIPNILAKKVFNVEIRKRENEKLIITQVPIQ